MWIWFGLQSIQKNHPETVFNVRNRGLFGAFDLKNVEERDKSITLNAKEGAIMLGCGTKSIRFRPHLNISRSEIDQGIDMINRALKHL